MGRQCSVCARQETLMAVNFRLAAGESQAEIAREFQFSPDALSRHASRHLHRDKKVAVEDHSIALMQRMLRHAVASADTCAATGDTRGLDSAVGKVVLINEAINKLHVQASGFESMTLNEQIEFIRTYKDGAVFRGLLDSILRDSESHGEHADSVQ